MSGRKPDERTQSVCLDLSTIQPGEYRMFDVSEYDTIKHLLFKARHKYDKVSVALWDRVFVLRKIPAMGFAFVGRPEEQ